MRYYVLHVDKCNNCPLLQVAEASKGWKWVCYHPKRGEEGKTILDADYPQNDCPLPNTPSIKPS